MAAIGPVKLPPLEIMQTLMVVVAVVRVVVVDVVVFCENVTEAMAARRRRRSKAILKMRMRRWLRMLRKIKRRTAEPFRGRVTEGLGS